MRLVELVWRRIGVGACPCGGGGREHEESDVEFEAERGGARKVE